MKNLMVGVVTLIFLGNVSAQESLEGKLVKWGDGKITITDKDEKLQVTYELDKDVALTCNGKSCKTKDIAKGSKVTIKLREENKKKIVVKITAVSDLGKIQIILLCNRLLNETWSQSLLVSVSSP